VEEYLEKKFTEADCQAYIAETCLSLLCSLEYCKKYDPTINTTQGQYRNRHFLLYSTVFWPWHFSRLEILRDIDSDPLMSLWDRFTLQSNYRRWVDYCHNTIDTKRWIGDLFWIKLGVIVTHDMSGHSLLSACIFGLCQRIKAAFHLWSR